MWTNPTIPDTERSSHRPGASRSAASVPVPRALAYVGTVLLALLLVLGILASPTPADASSDEGVAVVNQLRALAGLTAVPSDAGMRDGARKHSEYMAETSTVTHYQDPDSPHYTAEGDKAARESNLKARSGTSMTARQAVEALMTAPFHGIGFIDPRLQRSGGALHTDPDADRWRSTYTINVLGARSSSAPSGTRYPVAWPGDGSTVSLTSYNGNEVPDPLTSCSGWSAPTGLPILIQFSGSERIQGATVQDASGSDLSVCAFDQHTYSNPNGDLQHVGRSALGARNAGVVIPRQPLSQGETYTVEVRTNSRTVHWSFTVGSSNRAGNTTTTRSGAIGSSSDSSSDDGSGSSSGSSGSDSEDSSGSDSGGSSGTGSDTGSSSDAGSSTSTETGSSGSDADADADADADVSADDSEPETAADQGGDLRAASEALREADAAIQRDAWDVRADAEPADSDDEQPRWRRALRWVGESLAALVGAVRDTVVAMASALLA